MNWIIFKHRLFLTILPTHQLGAPPQYLAIELGFWPKRKSLEIGTWLFLTQGLEEDSRPYFTVMMRLRSISWLDDYGCLIESALFNSGMYPMAWGGSGYSAVIKNSFRNQTTHNRMLSQLPYSGIVKSFHFCTISKVQKNSEVGESVKIQSQAMPGHGIPCQAIRAAALQNLKHLPQEALC